MALVIRRVARGAYEAHGDTTARAYPAGDLLDFGESDVHPREVAGRARPPPRSGWPWRTAVSSAASPSPAAPAPCPTRGPRRGRDPYARGPPGRPRSGCRGALDRACLDRARATEGRTAVVLSTRGVMFAVHRIHERLGFVRTPERDGHPVPHRNDLTLIAHQLTL